MGCIMTIIDKQKISITSFSELKTTLEDNNDYNYIYLENDITIDEDIYINAFRDKITIDGTYLSGPVTIINSDYIINAGANNKLIAFKNLNITSKNANGIIYAPFADYYKDVLILFENINLSGFSLANVSYSSVKISNSIINVAIEGDTEPSNVCTANNIYIEGATTIDSNATHKQIFTFDGTLENPKLYILPNSDVVITSTKRELMSGTLNLDFKIMHDAKFVLTTFNGFSLQPTHGCASVLIDECATFEFLETGHQRIPMWVIYGTFTVNENANVSVITSYESTPSDNYNILFRGLNSALILNNPKSFVIYTKNANILYCLADTKFKFTFKRLNMWNESVALTEAGTINTLPDYYWCKDEEISTIEGTFFGSDTTITNHDLGTLDLSNFTFKGKKMFSIGRNVINVHPINNTSNKITGHTIKFSDALIEYNNQENIVTADENGLFEYTSADVVPDDSIIKITTCVPGSFIYETRNIVSPFDGELSIIDATNSIVFASNSISQNPYIFPRINEMKITIIDSRLNETNWSLYAKLDKVLTSKNNFTLEGAIVFKDFQNNYIILDTSPTKILEGTDKENFYTFSKDKGIILYLDNKYLEINEEYNAKISWSVEE